MRIDKQHLLQVSDQSDDNGDWDDEENADMEQEDDVNDREPRLLQTSVS